MDKITPAQLNSVLTATGRPSPKRLPNEELAVLGIMLEKAQRRWPNQDNSESIKEYLEDFEQLALKYSLQKIEAALERLRVAARENFFPSPNEVAEEIEAIRQTGLYDADIAEGKRRRAAEDLELARIGSWRARLQASGMTASEFIAWEDAQAKQGAAE